MKKVRMSLLIFIVLFISIGTIYATDNSTNVDSEVLNSHNTTNIELATNNVNAPDNTVGNTGNPKSFKDLQNLIDTNTDGIININDDYKFDSSSDDKNGIKITKNLTINGNNHFIDGNNEATLFNITNSTVTINDLTLENGKSTDFVISGGITSTGDELIINNCNFTSNVAYKTGGAIFTKSKLTIINNSNFNYNDIDTNNYPHDGGAIYADGLLIVNNTNFEVNGANMNCIGVINVKRDLTLDNCTFDTNLVGAVLGENISAKNCVFINNLNEKSGTLVGTNIKVNNCDFINNEANRGAGIYGDYVTVNNSRFINNTGHSTTNNLGSGIFSDNELNVSNSLFYGNTVNYRGGAILANGLANIDNCTFIENSAQKAGGAISGNNVNINNSKFINNTSWKYGGAVFVVNASINNSNFTDNYGQDYVSIATLSNYTIKNSNNNDNILSLNLTEITYAKYSDLIKFSNGYYGYCIEPYANTGGSGFAIDDLSFLTNINSGDDVSEYLKIFIWYYYNNTNATPGLDGYLPQQYLSEFTQRNFYSSKYPPIIKVIELYDSGFRVPTHNAVKKLDNGSYMVFNFKTFLTSNSYQNCIMFNVSYLDKLDTHMKVEKITITPVVKIGNKTIFTISVKNDCNYTLHKVFVSEDKWDDGLIYDSWDINNNWNYSFINNKPTWTYNYDLAPGESANFTVYFNTTKVGNFTNYVTANSEETPNITANNSTKVVNNTTPQNNTNKTENPKNHTNKTFNPINKTSNHNNSTIKVLDNTPKTGNPLIILLISILCLGIIPFKKH